MMHTYLQQSDKSKSIARQGRFWIYTDRKKYMFSWRHGTREHGSILISLWGIEHTLLLHLCIPFLFSWWFEISGAHGYNDERELSLQFFDGGAWWNVWLNPDEWRSTDPKWRRGVWRPLDTLLGRHKYIREIVREGQAEITMPEGAYKASYAECLDSWKRPRWPAKKTVRRFDIEMIEPIPEPGKGTEIYNLDDDALMGTTIPAETLEDAMNKVRDSVLDWRRKYGGASWQPSEGPHA